MKRNILWVLLSFLLVAALVLSSCAKEEVVEVEEEEEEEEVVEVEVEEEEEEEEEPVVGVPQYGGTLIVTSQGVGQEWGEPSEADVIYAAGSTVPYVTPVLDYLVIGDIDKYGPRGTNEFTFTSPITIPERFCGAGLAESWEVTPDRIVFHIRPGVYWAAEGKEHVMKSREYTAYDTVFSLDRYLARRAEWGQYLGWVESITATDRYTCVLETNYYTARWKWQISTGWVNQQYAPEVVEAGASDWKNLIGTGPFMFKKYITGSYMVYERNPLYWETTTINGKEYPIPFIDELVYAIIPDESTKIASLRTGKLDYSWGIPLRYEDTLRATCPDLSIEKAEGSWCHLLSLNLINSEIMVNRNVRRALFIGTNREAVAKAAWLEANLHSWPVSSKCPDVFTPFDELPASTQELYEYDPVKAKQMLADAGYPDGLKLRIPVDPGRVDWMDMVSLIADQWDEIGVELEIQATETVALQEIEANDYEGFDCWMWGEYNVDGLIALAHRVSDHARELNPWFLERLDEASLTTDSTARNIILKDMNWHALDEALHIPIGTPYELNASWPWVKNWYGENEESAWGTSHINARIWIDQVLKAELGY